MDPWTQPAKRPAEQKVVYNFTLRKRVIYLPGHRPSQRDCQTDNGCYFCEYWRPNNYRVAVKEPVRQIMDARQPDNQVFAGIGIGIAKDLCFLNIVNFWSPVQRKPQNGFYFSLLIDSPFDSRLDNHFESHLTLVSTLFLLLFRLMSFTIHSVKSSELI